MPHIEELVIITDNPFIDVQITSSIFPNLKKMRVWGRRLKSGELPAEIGNFKHLEHLELMSCGLTDFPPELKNLKSLKSLSAAGLVMKVFPTILCEMDGLESLTFAGQKIVNLPDSFSKLTALKTLNFSGSFNQGTQCPVNKWSDKPSYLQPIPEIIGKLPALQALDLSGCGVVNLAFLKPLKNLKSLKIKHSGLADCNELSHLNRLEILNLDDAAILSDIKGLTGLPIKNLSLRTCYELTSIDPILELTALEELNIESSYEIEDVNAIYQHPNLKVLKASVALVKKWELKEQFKNIPSLDVVIENLSLEDTALVEKAINDLAQHVDKNYHSDSNPLAGFFGAENDEEETVNLPALDAAFKKHKKKLSVDALVNLIKMSFQSVGEDNYTITLLVIKEIIKRKDVEAQQHVVAQFKEACAGYDFGHRYWGCTVHDQLFDDLFPAFESVALVDLLKNGEGDMLNCNGGDGGDRLFIPAFKKCKNQTDFKTLLTVFFEYQDDCVDYFGFQYFLDLHTEILAVLTKEYALKKFKDEVAKRNSPTSPSFLLDSNNPKDIIKLIELLDLDKEKNKDFFESNVYKIAEKINELKIPLNDVTTALDLFIKSKKASRAPQDILLKHLLPNGEDTVIAYLKTKENKDTQRYIEKVISNIIHELHIKNHSMEGIQAFREYLIEINNGNAAAVYSIEIEKLLDTISRARFHDDDFYKLLSRFEEVTERVKYSRIRIESSLLRFRLMDVSGENVKQWEAVKRLCKSLFPVISLEETKSALYVAVISALVTKDREFLKFSDQYIPETTEDEELAYNLACAYAVFSEKESMLNYIRRSVELGKTKAQFLDDNHFSQYKDDRDFLSALEFKA